MIEIKTMTRYQLLLEMAGHARPQWYHRLLELPTGALRQLLQYWLDNPTENILMQDMPHARMTIEVSIPPFDLNETDPEKYFGRARTYPFGFAPNK